MANSPDDPFFIRRASVAAIAMALGAAVSALCCERLSLEALICKNDAVLQQSRADQNWALYHMRCLRLEFSGLTVSLTANKDLGAEHLQKLERCRLERDEMQLEAQKAEEWRNHLNAHCASLLRIRHRHATATALFHVGMALSLAGLLARRSLPLYLAALAGLVALVNFSLGLHGWWTLSP